MSKCVIKRGLRKLELYHIKNNSPEENKPIQSGSVKEKELFSLWFRRKYIQYPIVEIRPLRKETTIIYAIDMEMNSQLLKSYIR